MGMIELVDFDETVVSMVILEVSWFAIGVVRLTVVKIIALEYIVELVILEVVSLIETFDANELRDAVLVLSFIKVLGVFVVGIVVLMAVVVFVVTAMPVLVVVVRVVGSVVDEFCPMPAQSNHILSPQHSRLV
jgi:hypothetical protein